MTPTSNPTDSTGRLSYSIRFDLAAQSAKSLRRWINAHDRWTAEVAHRLNGEYPARVRMPSKESKYRAYSNAARVVSLLDLDVKRASTVDDLRATLAAFAAHVGQ